MCVCIYIYIYICACDDQVQRILESNLPYFPDRLNPSKIGWLVKFNPFGSQLSHVNLKFPMCKSRHPRKNSQLCQTNPNFPIKIPTFPLKVQHFPKSISSFPERKWFHPSAPNAQHPHRRTQRVLRIRSHQGPAVQALLVAAAVGAVGRIEAPPAASDTKSD